MIQISNIKAFNESINLAIDEITFDKLVVADSDFAKHVNDSSFENGVGLVAVVPSSMSLASSSDDIDFAEVINFYFVKKWQRNDGYVAFVEIIEITQNVVKKAISLIAKSIQNQKCYKQFHNIKFNTLKVDPVSEYHGTVGYVLSFEIVNTYLS